MARLILSPLFRRSVQRVRRGVLAIAAALAVTGASLAMAPPAASQTQCGQAGGHAGCRFENGPLELDTEPVLFENRPQPYFTTIKGVDFLDSTNRRWSVPVGTLTDGASIPGIFIPLIGERDAEEYLQAAAVHDAYCGRENEDLPQYRSHHWEDVHRMFYDALIVNGVSPFKARVMYAAVYLGGPRWDDLERNLEDVSDELMIQEMEWCLHWLSNASPSPERIRDWMRAREDDLRAGTPVPPNFERLFAEDE